METPLEQGKPPIDKYWLELSDLTISDAALWMVINSDPQEHKERCSQDEGYVNYFDNHPGGARDVEKRCEVIFSAIRGGFIKTIEGMDANNDDLTTRTRIHKDSWINWCRQNGHPKLADLFESPQEGDNDTCVMATIKTGMTKREIMSAFDGLLFSSIRWDKNLASPPDWLRTCRISKGSKAVSAIWSPVLIAVQMHEEKQISLRKLDAVFVGLKEWTEEWQNASASFRL